MVKTAFIFKCAEETLGQELPFFIRNLDFGTNKLHKGIRFQPSQQKRFVSILIKFYKQTEGVAMDSPLSLGTILGHVVLSYHEKIK